jgi:hypothetical protein
MHECPNCGQACDCGGDIDDLQLDDTVEQEECMHCLIDDLDDDCESYDEDYLNPVDRE